MLHRLRDDEGTKLALRESLVGVGDAITGQSVAYAISAYWETGILHFEEQLELKNPPQPYSPETAQQLAKLAETRNELQDTLSNQTAVKWLHEMSYKLRDVRKGVYKDGYERADVVSYRHEQFLPSLKAPDDCMTHWELVQNDQSEEIHIVYPPNLPTGVRPIVPIVHDESTFNANDGRSKVWVKNNGVPLRKKTRGKGIMVSDFVTPGGRLQIPNEAKHLLVSEYGMTDEGSNRLDPSLAACSIVYGGDTWWDGDQLVD